MLSKVQCQSAPLPQHPCGELQVLVALRHLKSINVATSMAVLTDAPPPWDSHVKLQG